jgi:hypothetical protein
MVAHLFALTAALVSGRGMPIAGTRMRTTGAVALATPFTFDGRSSTISPYDNTNFQLARYGSSPVYSPVSMATSMYGGGGMMNSMYGGYGGCASIGISNPRPHGSHPSPNMRALLVSLLPLADEHGGMGGMNEMGGMGRYDRMSYGRYGGGIGRFGMGGRYDRMSYGRGGGMGGYGMVGYGYDRMSYGRGGGMGGYGMVGRYGGMAYGRGGGMGGYGMGSPMGGRHGGMGGYGMYGVGYGNYYSPYSYGR